MLAVLLLIALAAAGLDQLSKALIYGRDGDFIKGFICFNSVENRGVAWGIMNDVNGGLVLITILTVLITAILVGGIIKYRKVMPRSIAVSLAVIIGGALGNLIDRVFLGFVRDFICTEFISFPVFNVADIFVTCGGAALVAILLLTKKGRAFSSVVFPDNKKKDKKDDGWMTEEEMKAEANKAGKDSSEEQ